MSDKIFNKIVLNYSHLKFISRTQYYIVFKCINEQCDYGIHIYNDKRVHSGKCGECVAFKSRTRNENDVFDYKFSGNQKILRYKCKLCNGPRTRGSKTGICIKCLGPKPFVRPFKKLLESNNRNLEISITLEQYSSLMTNSPKCHYCENDLNMDILRGKRHCLDRKDNNIGYHINNIVPCCFKCNWIKGDKLTYREMLIIAGCRKRDLDKINNNVFEIFKTQKIDENNKTCVADTATLKEKYIYFKNLNLVS